VEEERKVEVVGRKILVARDIAKVEITIGVEEEITRIEAETRGRKKERHNDKGNNVDTS